MKCNIRELAHMSDGPCTIEGRLNYKKIYNGSYRNQSVFKERWFRLIKNYLFYFKLSEMGKFDSKNPSGVFVMENSSIQMEHGQSISFSFSISFIDEPDKRHVLAARCERDVAQWVRRLRQSAYEDLRARLHALQARIYSITGKDPLLLVPRNDGACLWAPGAPAACPAAAAAAAGFSCHLHAPELQRSRSDAAARPRPPATFYVEERAPVRLGRSKTQAALDAKDKFDSGVAYTRAAPSPPARRAAPGPAAPVPAAPGPAAPGPGLQAARERAAGAGGILSAPPAPPRRRASPRPASPRPASPRPASPRPASPRDAAPHEQPEDLITF